jgi:hypothetical protein
MEITKQMRAISLSDYQLSQIRAAAKTLLPSARADFLEGVARRLGAIAAQSSMNRLPVFLCDGRNESHLGITSQ